MTIKLGIVMDPISAINIKKDSSFAMLEEAQKRGYELFYLEMKDLYMEAGRAFGTMRPLTVKYDYADWYAGRGGGSAALQPGCDPDAQGSPSTPSSSTPPTCWSGPRMRVALSSASPRACATPTKLYTAWFAEHPDHTRHSQSRQAAGFHAKHKDVILKPLDGMGGASIFRMKEDDANVGVIIETLTSHGSQYCMAQTYLPAIKDGDKRSAGGGR